MVELVTIKASFFEVTIDYEKADIRLLIDRTSVLHGIFEALLPWNLKVDDIEVLTAGKMSEQGVMFRLPHKNISFFVGTAFCRFSRSAVDWASAEETNTILDTAVSALVKLSGVVLGTKKAAIGSHIQPLVSPFMEILRPFVPEKLASLESGRLGTMATVAKWENRKITIDGSSVIANGIFLKLERDFVSSTTHDEMARQLRRDEDELFAIMQVEENRQ